MFLLSIDCLTHLNKYQVISLHVGPNNTFTDKDRNEIIFTVNNAKYTLLAPSNRDALLKYGLFYILDTNIIVQKASQKVVLYKVHLLDDSTSTLRLVRPSVSERRLPITFAYIIRPRHVFNDFTSKYEKILPDAVQLFSTSFAYDPKIGHQFLVNESRQAIDLFGVPTLTHVRPAPFLQDINSNDSKVFGINTERWNPVSI